MLVLTILWLPVLIVPLVMPVHGAVVASFDTIDYTVWSRTYPRLDQRSRRLDLCPRMFRPISARHSPLPPGLCAADPGSHPENLEPRSLARAA
jgi:hypothetical protein